MWSIESSGLEAGDGVAEVGWGQTAKLTGQVTGLGYQKGIEKPLGMIRLREVSLSPSSEKESSQELLPSR